MSIIIPNMVSDVEARILETVTTFIRNLYLTAQLGQGISWNYDGTAIVLSENETDLLNVIQTHYNQSKIPSFVRQLNFYGFSKVMVTNPFTRRREAAIPPTFMHPYFRRGRVDLLIHVLRKTNAKGINTFHSVQDIVTLQQHHQQSSSIEVHPTNHRNNNNNHYYASSNRVDTMTTMDNPHNFSSYREPFTDNNGTSSNIGAISSLSINPVNNTSNNNNNNTNNHHYYRPYNNNNSFGRSGNRYHSFPYPHGSTTASAMPIDPMTDMVIDDLSNSTESTTKNYHQHNYNTNFAHGNGKYSKKSKFNFRNTLSAFNHGMKNTNNGLSGYHQSLPYYTNAFESGNYNDSNNDSTNNNDMTNDKNSQKLITSLQDQVRQLTLERDILRTMIPNCSGSSSIIPTKNATVSPCVPNTNDNTTVTMDDGSSSSSNAFGLSLMIPGGEPNCTSLVANDNVPMDMDEHLPSSTTNGIISAVTTTTTIALAPSEYHPSSPSLTVNSPLLYTSSLTSTPGNNDTTNGITDGFHLSNSILNPHNNTIVHGMFPYTIITSSPYASPNDLLLPANLEHIIFPSVFLTPSETRLINDGDASTEDNGNVHSGSTTLTSHKNTTCDDDDFDL